MRYRICTQCKHKLPATHKYFYSDYRTKDGLQARCKTCMNTNHKKYYENHKEEIRAYKRKYKEKHKQRYKEQRLIRNYGITLKQYNKIFNQQKGVCAICEQDSKLYVDHNHSTKRVRGLLCNNCNNGLGRFKDNINFLENAIQYLKGERYEA